MKKIMLFGFIVSLFTLNACGIHPRTDGKTGVRIMIDGNFGTAAADEEIYAGEAIFSPTTQFMLSLKVTAPDISPDLIFENINYVLGSEWLVLVPNGTARTFELSLYTYDPAVGSTNYFPIGLYKQTPLLTYDLNGSAITLRVTMDPVLLESVGTNCSDMTCTAWAGLLYINKGGLPTLLPQNCNIVLDGYLLDPQLPGVYLGPISVNIQTGGTDNGGKYLIYNVPADRPLQLAFHRPDMGWFGISDPFTIAGATIPYPLNDVVLQGWQPFSIQPADILIADSESTWGHPYGAGIVNAIGGWGNWGSGSFFSQMWSMGYASIMGGGTVVAPNAIVYKSTSAYGTDVMDNVTVTYQCGAVVDQATFKAHRYLAPWITSATDPLNPNNMDLLIYGYNFDGSTTQVSIGASLVPASLNQMSSSWYASVSYYYLSPLNLPDGPVNVRVQNYRSPGADLAFPSFSGFYHDIGVTIDNSYPPTTTSSPVMSAGNGNTKTLIKAGKRNTKTLFAQ